MKNRITSILDKAMPIRILESYLESVGHLIQIAKIGWGLSLVDKFLNERIALYNSYGIKACSGGTLFEYFYKNNEIDKFYEFIEKNNFQICEISDGSIDIDQGMKLSHIKRMSQKLICLSEVGSKDSSAIMSPRKWCNQIREELDAGASHVILEGRETGNAGIYRQSGEIRNGLIDEIIESGISFEDLIVEANNKKHQVAFIKRFGSNVNFGNIDISDVMPLETLRMGCRSDTINHISEPNFFENY
tara:strand:- start:197 stop:934 length:738 start_codon:yes stop_codon:yes gene_type:complete